jgi:hypothetical protein
MLFRLVYSRSCGGVCRCHFPLLVSIQLVIVSRPNNLRPPPTLAYTVCARPATLSLRCSFAAFRAVSSQPRLRPHRPPSHCRHLRHLKNLKNLKKIQHPKNLPPLPPPPSPRPIAARRAPDARSPRFGRRAHWPCVAPRALPRAETRYRFHIHCCFDHIYKHPH